MRKPLLPLIFSSIVALTPLPGQAVIAVIDHTAIANLVRQISYWQQQLAAMNNQLNQLRSTYSSVTGSRGMGALLPMTEPQRNYLPRDYSELMNTMTGHSTSYAGLASQIQAAMAANAVLSNAQLASMTPAMRQSIEDGRRAAAASAALSQAAYQNTSTRFAALQQLITMIAATPDLKAIGELQARINAEQTMLTNEQTKLQLLYQMSQANRSIDEQRRRENAAADVGSVNALRPVHY